MAETKLVNVSRMELSLRRKRRYAVLVKTCLTASEFRAVSQIVAAVGVEDFVVVPTRVAVLVAHKDRVQDVKVIAD